jgi:hypothetical protein
MDLPFGQSTEMMMDPSDVTNIWKEVTPIVMFKPCVNPPSEISLPTHH